MHRYETPEPITIALELFTGWIHVVATDRTDTTVEIRPADPGRPADARAAEEIAVEFRDGVLSLHAPKPVWRLAFGPNTQDVEIEIALPEGSALQGSVKAGNLVVDGRIGEGTFRTGAGEIRIERAGSVDLHASSGSILVDSVIGRAVIHAGDGTIRVRTIDGDARITNSSGTIVVGTATGVLEVKGSYGPIDVDRIVEDAHIATGYGAIRVDRVEGGEARLESGYGSIDVGVPEGVAAWVEAASDHGPVHSDLDVADGPGSAHQTARLVLRTKWGSIDIGRRPIG